MNKEQNSLEPNLKKGIGFILIAFFFMALFGVLLKAALVSTSALWVNFIAYFTGLILISFTLINKKLTFLKTDHFSYHFGRAFFGVLASFLYILSLNYIPLLNATLLFNTTPIFIPFFAMFLLSVKIQWSTWLSILIGFLGITLIIQPTEGLFARPGDLIGLTAGISLALAYTFIKMLTPYDPNIRIVFYFFFLATLLQIPFLFIVGDPPHSKEIVYAMLAGVALLLAQWFIVQAYSNAEASKVGVFQYTTIVWVGMIDWLLWGIIPGWHEIIGAVLVITAGTIIITNPTLAKTQ